MKEAIQSILTNLPPHVQLIAVTKTHPVEVLLEAYQEGLRIFGENKVQEMVDKYEKLPKDIQWHLIGHLQTNKVKYIASFVAMIHSVDSLKLLQEINKQAQKHDRIINCLLQVYIADEDTKFGLDQIEVENLLKSSEIAQLHNICVKGLMGMATNTTDRQKIRKEFSILHSFFIKLSGQYTTSNIQMEELSMGMSGDYPIAIEEGSTLIRVGSAIFGNR